MTGESGFDYKQAQKIFLLPTGPRLLLRSTQHPPQEVSGTVSQAIEQPMHWPQGTAERRIRVAIPPRPTYSQRDAQLSIWRHKSLFTETGSVHNNGTKKQHHIHVWYYYALSQNCEKRLLASSCLSVCPHETTRFPLDRFSCNLICENFPKHCRENSIFIKIGNFFF
jgi:hypothetical protein